jgi:hypothetical protein
MLYTFKETRFLRRGSPVGPTVAGVYALTEVSILFVESEERKVDPHFYSCVWNAEKLKYTPLSCENSSIVRMFWIPIIS